MKELADNLGDKRLAPTKLAFDRREASGMLGISPASLDRLVLRGLLKPSRALRKPLFAVSELERFLRDTTASTE